MQVQDTSFCAALLKKGDFRTQRAPSFLELRGPSSERATAARRYSPHSWEMWPCLRLGRNGPLKSQAKSSIAGHGLKDLTSIYIGHGTGNVKTGETRERRERSVSASGSHHDVVDQSRVPRSRLRKDPRDPIPKPHNGETSLAPTALVPDPFWHNDPE